MVVFYLYKKFFVLTLLIEQQEGHLTCNNLLQQLTKSVLVIIHVFTFVHQLNME